MSEEHTTNKTQVWLSHFRLGHPSFSLLKRMFPTMFGKLDIQSFHCDVCEFAKHHCVSFLSRNNKCSIPFSLIYIDVWGLTRIQSISRPKWFVSFIDDCKRVTWVFLMKHEFDVSTIFLVFHKMVKTQFDAKIQTVRFNNGREYFNQFLSSYFEKEGIIHQSFCTDTPQQNGVAGRKNRHLLEVTRALIFPMNVPKTYWGEAVLTAAHLINRLPSKVLDLKEPINLLTQFYPHFDGFSRIAQKIFGCVVFVHIQAHHRTKLDPQTLKMYIY